MPGLGGGTSAVGGEQRGALVAPFSSINWRGGREATDTAACKYAPQPRRRDGLQLRVSNVLSHPLNRPQTRTSRRVRVESQHL